MTEEIKQGMTRREVLKKGALFGGTLMWVAPVVQAVGMSPAMAKTASPAGMRCIDAYYTAPSEGSSFSDGATVNFSLCAENCGTDFPADLSGKAYASVNGGAETLVWIDLALTLDVAGKICVSYDWVVPDPGNWYHRLEVKADYGSQVLIDQDKVNFTAS